MLDGRKGREGEVTTVRKERSSSFSFVPSHPRSSSTPTATLSESPSPVFLLSSTRSSETTSGSSTRMPSVSPPVPARRFLRSTSRSRLNDQKLTFDDCSFFLSTDMPLYLRYKKTRAIRRKLSKVRRARSFGKEGVDLESLELTFASLLPSLLSLRPQNESAKITEKQHKKNIHFPLRSSSLPISPRRAQLVLPSLSSSKLTWTFPSLPLQQSSPLRLKCP